jgi:streptogramin lyase
MALTRPVLARTMPDGSGQAFPLSDWQRGPGLTHYASLALGSDGAVWMTQVLGVEEAILRVGPDGAVTRFPLPAGTTALEIAFGPDGAVWFSASGARIGRMTTGGAVTVAPASPPPWNTSVRDLARGPDPAIYFTVGRHREVGYVGRVTPGGSTSRLLLPEVGALTTGPDGALWIAGYLRIFRVSPEAVVAPRFSSGVTMARSSFRVGAGSSFRFSLSKAAKVTIAIERRISARRWSKAGRTLRRSGLQRTNQMPFDGRVGGRALPPGVYRARLRATDASGNRSGERRVRFRILRD